MIHLEAEDPWLVPTRPRAPVHREQCWGRAVEARRAAAFRRIQTLGSAQKTSPVPRLVGNPPAVRRAFLFHRKGARRASVISARLPQPPIPNPRSVSGPRTAPTSIPRTKRDRAATVKERFSHLAPTPTPRPNLAQPPPSLPRKGAPRAGGPSAALADGILAVWLRADFFSPLKASTVAARRPSSNC